MLDNSSKNNSKNINPFTDLLNMLIAKHKKKYGCDDEIIRGINFVECERCDIHIRITGDGNIVRRIGDRLEVVTEF